MRETLRSYVNRLRVIFGIFFEKFSDFVLLGRENLFVVRAENKFYKFGVPIRAGFYIRNLEDRLDDTMPAKFIACFWLTSVEFRYLRVEN